MNYHSHNVPRGYWARLCHALAHSLVVEPVVSIYCYRDAVVYGLGDQVDDYNEMEAMQR